MGRQITNSGKRSRPKTAFKGKRYRCALCKKRSPRKVPSAPYYCPLCAGVAPNR